MSFWYCFLIVRALIYVVENTFAKSDDVRVVRVGVLREPVWLLGSPSTEG